jgi:hypothetical protein
MGKEVFAAAKVKGELLLVPEASHNDVALAGGAEYWRWLSAALKENERQGLVSGPASQ